MKLGAPLLPISPESDYDKQLNRRLYDYFRPLNNKVNHPDIAIILQCSDETTALTTGTAKTVFRAPYGISLTGVRGSLTTAQTSGSIFTVDVNVNGTTILSTNLTIDNTEKTSVTAASQPVISVGSSEIREDAEISIDIDQVGDGTAKGLKVTLLGMLA